MSAGGSLKKHPPHSPLAWLERAVIYQIYVQSFCDSNGDGIGDLPGIASKLEYLEWLGVDLLWLSPIYRSPFKDAGYDVTDHRAVAERYGTLRDFDRLVAECHRRGMRLILDLVPAHTSNEHIWFRRSASARRNRYTDWYIWTDSGFGDLDQELVRGFGERQGHYKPNFFWFQPALNYGYAAPSRPWQHATGSRAPRQVFAELLRTMSFWLDRGVDGFRADMAASLVKDDPGGRENQQLWREVRAWMDRAYPGRLLVSEWSWPSRAIGAGFHVDFMIHFNNEGYNSLFRLEPGRNVFPSNGHSFFDRAGKGDVNHFLTLFRSFLKKTRGRGFISIPTGNHDLPRLNCRRSARELRTAYVFLLTLPAVPAIYYGDEIGMRNPKEVPNKEGGFIRTQARTPMLWRDAKNAGFSSADAEALYLPVDPVPPLDTAEEQRSDPQSLLHFVRRLIALRRQFECLGAAGEFIPLLAAKGGYPLAYLRRLRGQEALIVVNPCGRTAEARLPSLSGGKAWRVLVRGGVTLESTREVRLRSRPFGYLVALRSILCLGLLILACFAGRRAGAASVPGEDDWRRLSLREKIGQTMILLPNRARELELGHGSLRGFFQKYPVGGFFMGWKLFDGIKEADRTQVMLERVREYQEASRLPLLFQQDYESGVSLPGMTAFPNEMALGAAHSEALAYAYGTAVARESRSVGVNWVLNPVADLNLNPLNPIDNIRSISDDPGLAIRLLREQIAGLQDHGVAATIKHFPGDGVDYRDQHLLTTTNGLSLASWRQYHGRVFQALIDSGVDVIMPGHITFPAYQHEKLNGLFPPATLSKELLTGLLKGEMGFKGVVISDAMVMGGFRGWYPNDLEGEIHSFLAGIDVLLWPSYDYLDEMERRIRRGEIPMRRLDDAVARIWALKRKLGLFAADHRLIQPLQDGERAAAEATARAICANAVTLVRDRHHALPLDPVRDRKLLLLGVAPISRKGGQGGLDLLGDFQTLLQSRGFTVDYQHDLLYETQGWTETLTSQYDRIIVLALRSPHSPYGTIGFYDDEAQTVWGINAMPKDKVIVVSLGSPYLGGRYFERVDTYINAYSNTPATHEAVVQALLGDIPFRGQSPVSLAGPRFAY